MTDELEKVSRMAELILMRGRRGCRVGGDVFGLGFVSFPTRFCLQIKWPLPKKPEKVSDL